jgi:hypothetical protein
MVTMKQITLLFALGAEALLVMLLVMLLASAPSTLFAADSEASPDLSGMVWEKHGEWHLNGGAGGLRLGEAIPPGGLVTAGSEASPHSITILLPDGQRMLCECYEPRTCSQGFRVPAITAQPPPAVWAIFVAVRNVLLLRPETAETAFSVPVGRAALAANVEMVAALNPQGELSTAAGLRVLPNGQYSLTITGDGQQASPSTLSTQPLNWVAGQTAAQVRVGGPGVYRIRVFDQTRVPRIDVEVLATSPVSFPSEAANLKQARETILSWSKTHEGWSLHPFLRAYLQSRANALSP